MNICYVIKNIWREYIILDIIEILEERKEFSILLQAIENSLMRDKLRFEGPFTLLAVRDENIDILEIEKCLKYPVKIRQIILFHILSGIIKTTDLIYNRRFRTLLGAKIHFKLHPILEIENSRILEPDIEAKNGVVHIIEEVLIPKEKARDILFNPHYHIV